MKKLKLWDKRNVCAKFELMRNPIYLILPELYHLKTELIANCVYVVAIIYNTSEKKHKPSFVSIMRTTLDYLHENF